MIRDTLTGMPSRRALHDALKSLAGKSHQADRPTSALFVDLDDFARFNHRHGHVPAGDNLLREVADVIRAACPPPALLYRVGGDEFVILLDGTPLLSALKTAESLAEAVRRQAESRKPEGLTASIGVATTPLRKPWNP